MIRILVIFILIFHCANTYVYHKIYSEATTDWMSPQIRYMISGDNITPLEKVMLKTAMQEISSNSCLSFIEVNLTETPRICSDFEAEENHDIFDFVSDKPQPRLLCFVKYQKSIDSCEVKKCLSVNILSSSRSFSVIKLNLL